MIEGYDTWQCPKCGAIVTQLAGVEHAPHACPTFGESLPPIPSPYLYNAVVQRVIDGDTVVTAVDWGFFRYDNPIHVRLLGCNAAELGTPGGDAARDNLVALLPAGTPLVLRTAKPDKFAPRWDAAVTYPGPDGPRDLVTDLLEQQWVAPWDGKGKAPVPPWPRTVA